ncbi:xanthine dehydrogenase family protein molybdopterin-binding subunit [Algihabitans albus]|uniref:xanthine dehydrogenase family protein molybdopterin-binding subunit n=1 Tax=Algihabitans albus TaxID=2164067 RepID=UPI001ABC3398|nr:xanthine dehydrogenase family protein molybdopterin-binding subunit [Algihabitans albus]
MLPHAMSPHATRLPNKLMSAAVSRRRFLIGAAAAGTGLTVGFKALPLAADGGAATEAGNPFQSYVEIAGDGRVTVLSSQFEMGQGSYHGLATLVVEELDCDWNDVQVVGASGSLDVYGNLAWGGAAQGTGGSTSMATSWDRYRQAGATAKAMLKTAAAEAWGVPAEEIEAEAGVLRHAASGNESTYGALAAAAAAVAVPSDVALKTPEEWRQIGNPDVLRYDRVGKTNGTQDFTLDVQLPGMLTATMIHPPKFGAKLVSFDGEAAKAMPGVVEVVAVPRGIAVVAEDTWSAINATYAVEAEWDESEAETRGSAEILSEYRELAGQEPMALARDDGDVEAALAEADRVIEARYEFPFLAHAALEPLNAVAHMTEEGTLEVWGGHQIPGFYQYLSSQIAELPPERVKMHVLKTGGSFGRRAVGDGDVVAEAVSVAKALDWRAPVKVQWTRENDMRGGRYRPAYVHRLRAGLDADGRLIAWDNHIVGQSIVSGTPFEGLIQNGIDNTSVEGSSTLPYAIPNLRVGLTTTDVKVPVLWWRAVGSTHTAYATEVFLDEVAEAVGADPVQFRLDLLQDHPRHAEVLRLAAERAGWGEDLPEGHFHGVSVHESFASYVAQVAEVSVEDGQVRVHKVVCAVDCGVPINPDTIRAQMEGGIGFGLGSILQEELTLIAGEVDQGNYDGYRPLRISQMPEVEVVIVDSPASPTGVGEPGTPPIGPAVANAVYRATGRRVRELPFEKGLTT